MSKCLEVIYPLEDENPRLKKSVVLFTNDTNYSSDKMAAFDMDWTLIKPLGKGIYIKNPQEMQLWSRNVAHKIKQLSDGGYKIVVFSNQSGLESKRLTLKSLARIASNLFELLHIPKIQIFIAAFKNHYRKPSTAIWELMVNRYNRGVKVDMKKSFYVGDAAGRLRNWQKGKKPDFSAADRKFAANLKLKFKTPEEFFNEEKVSKDWVMNGFDAKLHINELEKRKIAKNDKINKKIKMKEGILILVGPPSSGKTFFAIKNFKDFIIISKHQLKTHRKCVKACKDLLRKRKRKILIDNNNSKAAERQDFIDLANTANLNFKIVYFKVPKDLPLHLNLLEELKTKSEKRRITSYSLNKFFREIGIPVGENVIELDFVPEFDNKKDRDDFLAWT